MSRHPELPNPQPGGLFSPEFQECQPDPMAALIWEIHKTEWEYEKAHATKDSAA